MRLDKFLKVSRLIKRRAVASEACRNGRVIVNGRIAKPGADVGEGDVLELSLGPRRLKLRVTGTAEGTGEMYTILEEGPAGSA